MSLLHISDLHVSVDKKTILHGVHLDIKPGEVHVILGPNGAGKSTLSHVLCGKEDYNVTKGTVTFQGEDLIAMLPEVRARKGLFLAFQYPVELPGVSNETFLRVALNEHRKFRGEPLLDSLDFQSVLEEAQHKIGLRADLLARGVNEGFSGGEKKRNEMLQMMILQPKLAILDETDSGLDVDALRIVADGVNSLRAEDRGFLIITHYEKLLDMITPTHVHVMVHGKIVKTGGMELSEEIHTQGFTHYLTA